MASFELLSALNFDGVNTTEDVARELEITLAEAGRQLRAAKRDGLVFEDADESVNVPKDFNRQRWTLTAAGWAEWEIRDRERSSG